MEVTIGANIKRLRMTRNITQEQLATAMNVSCAAVSKWERGETFPDITLLQPLAYYFEVTLDELMDYDQEKVKAQIEEVIAEYKKHWMDRTDKKGTEIIKKAYRDFPNDHRIMHYYMWHIAGDMADNDPKVLLEHKEEFREICEKILSGCTDETLRLNAWNMRAKLLHAEGKTDEALEIYKTKFHDWFSTTGQKSEQLFAKDTEEYYFFLKKNLFELANFAGDKLGRKVFFDPSMSLDEKTKQGVKYANILLKMFEETGEAFCLMLAESFLGRLENDLCFRGGSDEQVVEVMDIALHIADLLQNARERDKALDESFNRFGTEGRKDYLKYILKCRLENPGGRRAELLQNASYREILDKYR